MRKIVSTTVLVMAMLMAGCGGDSHDSVMQESISVMNEFATIMEGVTDVASAKAAAPKIEALAAKSQDLKKRMDAVGKPTPEQEKVLKEKYEKQMMEVMPKMMGAMMKSAMDPEIQKVLEGPLKKFGDNMK